MGMYIAESGRFVRASIDRLDDHFDVFVSHKWEDEGKAKKVAKYIKDSGLEPWLDVVDLAHEEDDENMVHRIEHAIEKSLSLLAIVTEITYESWWVPFEIGLAYDKRKLLASYSEWHVNLPSFLSRWPLVKNQRDLGKWCHEVSALRRMHPRESTADAVLESDPQRRRTRPYSRMEYRQALRRVRETLNRN